MREILRAGRGTASSSTTKSEREARARGAAIGGALFLPGVGVIGGTVAGALHHKSLGMSDADKARLTVELNAGKAAVGVLAHVETATAISDRLVQLGGATEAHELSDAAVQAAAEPAPA